MGVFIRISLRYLAGFLIAKGLLDSSTGSMLAEDPELVSAIELAVGAILIALSEGWYWLAKRLGWRT